METTQGENIAFLSGGNLSKSSYNKLNRYREKLSKNYDDNWKKEIKNFLSDLNKGEFDRLRFEKILDKLHLIKDGIDDFDYTIYRVSPDHGKWNLLQQFIQRNMYSKPLLKKLYYGKEK